MHQTLQLYYPDIACECNHILKLKVCALCVNIKCYNDIKLYN